MARPVRYEIENGIYFIECNGKKDLNIFKTVDNKVKFLLYSQEVIKRYKWKILGFCILSNSYYLIVNTPYRNLSDGIRLFNSKYTKYYNGINVSKGKIFNGRFKSVIIQKELYFKKILKYILLRPEEENKDFKKYKFSAYKYIIFGKDLPFLNTDDILQEFEIEGKKSRNVFNNYMNDNSEDVKDIRKNIKYQAFLGNDDFIQFVKEKSDQNDENKVELEELFKIVNNKDDRDKMIYYAHMKHGVKFNDMAKFLDVHVSTVSKAFKRVKENLNS